jgi:DNA-binding CsgD family transcriptional regulator
MNKIVDFIVDTMPSGAIVFNQRLDIIFQNKEAVNFLSIFNLPEEITNVSTRIFKAMNNNKLEEQFPGEIYITKKLDSSSSNWTFRMFFSKEPEPLVAVFIIEETISNKLDMNRIRQRFRLTRRETDVLRRVIDGLKNSEIARSLEIAEQTVKDHLSNIYMKSGFENRLALMRSLLSF